MIDQLFALRQSEELNIEKIFIPKNTRNFATPTLSPKLIVMPCLARLGCAKKVEALELTNGSTVLVSSQPA